MTCITRIYKEAEVLRTTRKAAQTNRVAFGAEDQQASADTSLYYSPRGTQSYGGNYGTSEGFQRTFMHPAFLLT